MASGWTSFDLITELHSSSDAADLAWPSLTQKYILAQEYGPPFAETGMLAPVLWGMDDKKNGGLSDNVGHFAKMGMKKTTPIWQQGGIGDSL